MDKDWVKIFTSSDSYRVEIFRALLEDNGIAAVIISHQDSMYVTINAGIDLYVHRDHVIQAKRLIENTEGS